MRGSKKIFRKKSGFFEKGVDKPLRVWYNMKVAGQANKRTVKSTKKVRRNFKKTY